MNTVPTTGKSASTGTSNVWKRSTPGVLARPPSQTAGISAAVTPRANRLMAVADTIWSARTEIENQACTQPMPAPTASAATRPSRLVPVHHVTATPAKAPKSILPSRAMLMTPARSLSSPPSAAKIKGTDSRMP